MENPMFGQRSYINQGVFLVLTAAIINTATPLHISAQNYTESLSRNEILAEQNRAIELHTGPIEFSSDFLSEVPIPTLDGGPQYPAAIVVQLPEPLNPARRNELLEAGIGIEEYLGGTTYLFSIPPGASSGFLEPLTQGETAGTLLKPQAKIHPNVFQPMAVPQELDDGSRQLAPQLTVQFLSTMGADLMRAALDERGFEVVEQINSSTFVVAATPEDAEILAAIPGISFVDSGPLPLLPLNDTVRRNTESDMAQQFSLSSVTPAYGGVTGRGIRIAVADTGIDENHRDFQSLDGTGTSRVYRSSLSSGSHGTHVASIVAGNGVNSSGNQRPAFAMRGHAPEATLGDYGAMYASTFQYHDAIVSHSTDLSNHSYVGSNDGYSLVDQGIDRLILGEASHNGVPIPARPQVWAAGNNGVSAQYGNDIGFYSVFVNAKNMISVGSVDSRNNRVSRFSSLGPSFDGRIKPDVVAPGCIDSSPLTYSGVQAAKVSSQSYLSQCGTSMSAPAVAGAIALMMDSYDRAGSQNGDALPSTYKAILIHPARDMVKTADFNDREFNNPDTGASLRYHRGPDFATGFGLIDSAAAVEKIVETDSWRQSRIDATGDVDAVCVNVPAGVADFHVALVWDDAPGSPLTSITTSKLVNDLDLELQSPDGTIIRPWTIDPLPVATPAGGGSPDPITTADIIPAIRRVDHRNNVEVANQPLPETGEWRIRIRGFNLPLGTSQSYSLVASEIFQSVCMDGTGRLETANVSTE